MSERSESPSLGIFVAEKRLSNGKVTQLSSEGLCPEQGIYPLLYGQPSQPVPDLEHVVQDGFFLKKIRYTAKPTATAIIRYATMSRNMAEYI